MNVLGQDAPGNLLDLMNLQGSVSLLKSVALSQKSNKILKVFVKILQEDFINNLNFCQNCIR